MEHTLGTFRPPQMKGQGSLMLCGLFVFSWVYHHFNDPAANLKPVLTGQTSSHRMIFIASISNGNISVLIDGRLFLFGP
ncbi:hypothetical protein F5050DRAFT_1474152 [Lentinula boryana]|uniref:Uncharacterized protein n=1 Tax=Lentinula boryana TaxID=40481 RepID=A0ABQ8QSP4_9AGAR|nr:hypothetical protein F5050DRAFT_1474152 [Lentinula boryana]